GKRPCFGINQCQRPPCATSIGGHYPSFVHTSPRRPPEHPLCPAELRLVRWLPEHGPCLKRLTADVAFVERPPSRAIADKVKRAVRGPARLKDGFVRSARDQFGTLEHPSLGDRGNPQFGAIPRHLGMTPRQPTESRPVGAQSRGRVEVVSSGDHLACVRIAVERNRDHGVNRLPSFVCVILTHTDEAPTTIVYCSIRIEPLAFGSDWAWYVGRVRRRTGATRRRPADPINSLIREVGVIGHAVRHDVRAAAVLVHAASHVVIWRRQVADRAIGAASDEHVAPAFLRTSLEPVDVVAVTRDKTQAESLLGNCRGGDARRPGAVRSDDRHDSRSNLSLLCGLASALARSLSRRDLRTGAACFGETDGDGLFAA